MGIHFPTDDLACVEEQACILPYTIIRGLTQIYAPRSYFTSATEQRRALEALGDIFLAVELDLYDASVCAFDSSLSAEEKFRCFLHIYNELASPGPPSYWNVFRPSSPVDCWRPEKIFETIKREFSEFSRYGTVNLMNFGESGTARRLQSCLLTMSEIKPKKGFPIMTVSKFLHF